MNKFHIALYISDLANQVISPKKNPLISYINKLTQHNKNIELFVEIKKIIKKSNEKQLKQYLSYVIFNEEQDYLIKEEKIYNKVNKDYIIKYTNFLFDEIYEEKHKNIFKNYFIILDNNFKKGDFGLIKIIDKNYFLTDEFKKKIPIVNNQLIFNKNDIFCERNRLKNKYQNYLKNVEIMYNKNIINCDEFVKMMEKIFDIFYIYFNNKYQKIKEQKNVNLDSQIINIIKLQNFLKESYKDKNQEIIIYKDDYENFDIDNNNKYINELAQEFYKENLNYLSDLVFLLYKMIKKHNFKINIDLEEFKYDLLKINQTLRFFL